MIKWPFKSVPEILKHNSVKFADKPALGYKKSGKWVDVTYARFYELALMVARGLRKLGIKPGDRVAILSENRPGWVIADMGILSAGAVTVPIYATNTPEQVKYVLNHSESRVVFISNKVQYDKLVQIKDEIPHVEHIISFDRFLGTKDFPVNTHLQLAEISVPLTDDEKNEIEEIIAKIEPDDLATLIYTSGTTGVPKGVMLTHYNFVSEIILGTKKVEVLKPEDKFLSFLPLSHALERAVGYYIPIYNGCQMVFAESIDKVPENMVEVKPTWMVSVPRLFEKMYSRIYENVHAMSGFKKSLFHKAVEVGKKYVEKKYIKKENPGMLSFKYAFFDKLIFSKIRERFGGNIQGFVSGGAPLDKNINEFFWVIGMPIFEGYGLTETSPGVCINTFKQVRFGSVGTMFEHTYAKLDEDGELLLKGPMIMKGYYKNEEATKEALDEEGWFRTGDIGKIDEDGFLYIVDRKKELIITAGGKNIAPQPIENELKLDKYISQAFVYGDRKPYLVALLVPNFERIVEYAKEHHIEYFDMNDLVANEKILKLFKERVEEINKKLPKYETIKKFSLVPVDFTIEGGELTPTLKLKRRVIYNKYKDKIECLYSDDGDCFTCT
ncbi:long-chain fatty-acid-CoA ligase [Deferribacter desulfuricans SSM1]|uniref:Long-chain fatty-acid-CoA ligase n=1 Tax=Deferribacter desulfuricans (strain DSM 14783 / JCM 11476 / NBRC 101012 / SSM1) TaxID=639282 RepID=D3PEA5_DEFDS|nr:long-chain fatty acid--CoA ligase [Deferribacter desulfuricans]BAI80928.1 long-chain fatty-acid-CoA ligase [Deferribacter desulfuricans SSM1]